ncbi:putative outer membrane protein A [hydrothermal vent metagenome]|uniref:Putative outer membrane protein A n=1 Tax=hydrothermal vent metagenome TaxID=652676 RepID=A0A1W1B8H5_9ZZZZ
MKYRVSLAVSFLILGKLSFAGGDIAPAKEPIAVVPVVEDSGIYLGIGASSMSLDNDLNSEEFSAKGIMIQAGYQFNQYIAIEGRYTINVGNLEYDHGTTNNPDYSDYPADFTNLALYLKPMYSLENFSIYGLLGYGEVTLTDLPHPNNPGSVERAERGFQWGLGASYKFMNNLSIFIDYTRVYDDKGFDYRAQDADITSDLWTLGVSYRF